jgi:uncharacterized protein YjfI (DUF2170 family)
LKKKLSKSQQNALTKQQFLSQLALEAECEDIEDKYVTACYILMREFGCLDIEVLKRLPATTFIMLLEEMEKQAEREKQEMEKNKHKGYK